MVIRVMREFDRKVDMGVNLGSEFSWVTGMSLLNQSGVIPT